MALRYEDIQRLKFETGYNVVAVGAELYVLNGYAAVFDSAIAPYLLDQGSTSTTVIQASPSGLPSNVVVLVAANPPVSGNVVNPATAGSSVYGAVFQVGSKLVVDIGPNQETDVVVQAVQQNGLALTLALANAHGVAGPTPTHYPVVLQGGEFLVRDVLKRLDIINAQMKGFAPVVAGLAQADGGEAKFYASQRGRRGQKDTFDGLVEQRDMARRDLCALLGIENLWEKQGKHPNSAGLSYGRY